LAEEDVVAIAARQEILAVVGTGDIELGVVLGDVLVDIVVVMALASTPLFCATYACRAW